MFKKRKTDGFNQLIIALVNFALLYCYKFSTVTNVQKSTKSNWAPNLVRYKTERV